MVYTRTEKKKEHLDFWKRFKVSELGIRIIMIAIIVVGGFAYLVLTTSTATRGLEVKELSDRLDTLTSQREVLQATVDRLQSISHLDAAQDDLELVQVTKLDYVATPAGAVASR